MSAMFEFAGVECGDPLGIMDAKPLACRGCLAAERPLRPFEGALGFLFEQLTGTPVSPSDIYPKFLCSYCRALLTKFSKFKEKCLSAQETFTQLHFTGITITKEVIQSSVAGLPYPLLTTTFTQLISIDSHEQTSDGFGTVDQQITENNTFLNNLTEDNVLDDFLTFHSQGDVSFDVCRETEHNEEIKDITETIKLDPDSVSEDDASDMPDCLVGLDSDIYTKDSKKPFKCEVTNTSTHKAIKTGHGAKTCKKVAQKHNENKDFIIEETRKWIEQFKAKKNITKKTETNPKVKGMTPTMPASSYNQESSDSEDVSMGKEESNLSDSMSDTSETKPLGLTDVSEQDTHNSNSENQVLGRKPRQKTNECKQSGKEAKNTSPKRKPSFSIKAMRAFVNKIKDDIKNGKKKTSKRERYLEKLKNSFAQKYNVTIIKLSKEEQIEQFMARKDAPRYKNSKFKCELCYKGFLFEDKYKTHYKLCHQLTDNQQKHVCNICNIRFKRIDRHRHDHTRNFKCNECGVISITNKLAIIHYKNHRGIKYDCKICGKTFNRQNSVLGHMHISHGGTDKCSICNLKFIGPKGLHAHMKLSHKEAVGAVCGTCGVQFHSHDALRRHLPQDGIGSCDHTHRPCAACGEGFPTEELLRQHKQKHQGNQFTCEQCGKTYTNKEKYRSHMYQQHIRKKLIKTEMQPDPGQSSASSQDFICEYCGIVKQSHIQLESHKRTHTRPFQCDHCQRRFTVKINLKTHILRHHLQQPVTQYPCKYCAKTFTSQSNAYRHVKGVHLKERPYKCDLCENTFFERSGLKVHIDTKHKGLPWPKRTRNRPKPNP